jgi:hypothetical protein
LSTYTLEQITSEYSRTVNLNDLFVSVNSENAFEDPINIGKEITVYSMF